MATVDDLQKQHEARIAGLISELQGKGGDSDWALVRALVHKAMHLCAERKAGEFCALATFLAEMVGHAHQVMHGGDKPVGAHSDIVH